LQKVGGLIPLQDELTTLEYFGSLIAATFYYMDMFYVEVGKKTKTEPNC